MYDLEETETYDVEFALKMMGNVPKKVLEIACGSGRFLVPMAKAGHDVVGLDFDEHMLARISEKAAKEKVQDKLVWRKADVVRDDWGTDFDVVVLAGNFLYNIVTEMGFEEAQKLMIQKAADALCTGGHVLIDCGYTKHPEQWFDNPNANVVWEGTDSHGTSGKMILLNSSYDKESRMNQFIRRFEMTLTDGSSLVQDIPSEKHFASLEQIHTWLTDAGFVIEKECGDYEENPVSDTTHRAIIWAKKV